MDALSAHGCITFQTETLRFGTLRSAEMPPRCPPLTHPCVNFGSARFLRAGCVVLYQAHKEAMHLPPLELPLRLWRVRARGVLSVLRTPGPGPWETGPLPGVTCGQNGHRCPVTYFTAHQKFLQQSAERLRADPGKFWRPRNPANTGTFCIPAVGVPSR